VRFKNCRTRGVNDSAYAAVALHETLAPEVPCVRTCCNSFPRIGLRMGGRFLCGLSFFVNPLNIGEEGV
jgi:hypothetical protein